RLPRGRAGRARRGPARRALACSGPPGGSTPARAPTRARPPVAASGVRTQGLLEAARQLALLLAQLRRDSNVQDHVLVATGRAAQRGKSEAAKEHVLPG